MKIIRNFAIASSLIALASCGSNNDENYDTAGGYDTSDPYGVPSADGYESAPYQPVNPPANNPTYGAPAYDTPATTTPSAPPLPATPPEIASSHTIVKGDTLWGLSRKYGVSEDAIRAANGMAAGDNNVRLGQSVNIPAP